MKEKTSRSKQNSVLFSATADEIFVAQILLDLPNTLRMLESGSAFEWGCKKRRSRFNDFPITSLQKNDVEIEEGQPQPKAAEGGAAANSPVTPLAFSPSESDEKSRRPFKRSSKKLSREKYIGMMTELTQRRDLLKEEIGNVTNYYKKLIAYNSELKEMKQKFCSQVQKSCQIKEPKVEISRNGNAGMELTQHDEIILEQPQPLVADQMAEKFQHSIGPIATAQFHPSYHGLGSVNYVGQHGIPDLNVSAEEAFDLSSQPLDMRRNFLDRRARFAEARRRRMDIIKIKNISASCGIKFTRTR